MEPKTNIKDKLTPKEERFCYEYCIDLNATQAAIRAGYSKKTAYSSGNRMLKNVEIQNRIQQMRVNLAETAGTSSLKVLNEHKKIAFSHLGTIYNSWLSMKDFDELSDDVKACIQEVQTKETKREINGVVTIESWVKIKLYDKQKSLDSISNILGFNAPKKIEGEISGNLFFELMKQSTCEDSVEEKSRSTLSTSSEQLIRNEQVEGSSLKRG